MIKDLVSIIIPTHKGAEEATAKCVASVKESTYKNIEIIVVNEGLERSAQRNIGIDRARGKYLLILDSDTTIHCYLIKSCIMLMDYGYSALYIPEIIKTDGFFGRLRNWERQFYTGTCIDVVRFLRANHCPKFDLTMSGPEDSDFDRRVVGLRSIAYYPLYHYDNVGLIKYLQKKAYYTKSMQRYKDKHPNDKVLTFSYRCFGVFIENKKWKKLIAKPYYAFMLMLLVFARGVIYLCRKR